jgi:putative AdoMet-dependent methyltransferase
VLDEVVGGAGVEDGAGVLDVGTGALAARLAAFGCRVLGVDLSAEMLAQAHKNVPTADFQQLELLGDWGDLGSCRFDAVVSGYVLHEFDLPTKHALLIRLAALLNPGGRVVIGDISFETLVAREAAQRRWRAVWDESEHYWVAEDALPSLQQAGFSADYRQLSFYAEVYTLQPLMK